MEKYHEIRIDGPNDHVEEVKSVLAHIARNEVGRTILFGLAATGKDITIVPYTGTRGFCNATAKARSPRDAAPDGVRGDQQGAGWYKGDENDRYRQVPWKAGYATGKGSDSEVRFSPHRSDMSSCAGTGPGSYIDQVLLHELVHALRHAQGRDNPIPTEESEGMAKYDNEEEFLAIIVTNVYLSANGNRSLRADHHSHRRLMPPLDTSAGFLAHPGNKKLMNIYRLVWQPTFQQLSWLVTAPFNPFRQLEADLAYLR